MSFSLQTEGISRYTKFYNEADEAEYAPGDELSDEWVVAGLSPTFKRVISIEPSASCLRQMDSFYDGSIHMRNLSNKYFQHVRYPNRTEAISLILNTDIADILHSRLTDEKLIQMWTSTAYDNSTYIFAASVISYRASRRGIGHGERPAHTYSPIGHIVGIREEPLLRAID